MSRQIPSPLPALALLLAAALAPGCAYGRSRVADLGESFHVGLAASLWPGLYAYVQAPLFATSLGYVPDAVAIGNDYGYDWAWHQGAFGLILGGQNVRAEMGHPVRGFLDGRRASPYLDQSHFLVLNTVATDRRTAIARSSVALTKVEAGAHALFVGAAVGLDFVELLDFLCGLFTWDLLDDDDFVPTYLPADEPATPGSHVEDGEVPAPAGETP